MNNRICFASVLLIFLVIGCRSEKLCKQTNMLNNFGLVEIAQNQDDQLLTNPHTDLDRGLFVEAESILGPREIKYKNEKIVSLEVVLSLTFNPEHIDTSYIHLLLQHPALHFNYGIDFVSLKDSTGEYIPDDFISGIGTGSNSYPHPLGQIWFEGYPFQPPVIELQDKNSAIAVFSVTIFAYEGVFETLQQLEVEPVNGSIEKLIQLEDDFVEHSNTGTIYYGKPKLLRILPDDNFNWLLPTY